MTVPTYIEEVDGETIVAAGAKEITVQMHEEILAAFGITPVSAGDPCEATLTQYYSNDGTNWVDVSGEEIFNENAGISARIQPMAKWWKFKVENTGSNSFKLYATVGVRR